MNENIDLAKILKDCPKGTKLYSPIFGEVEFETISYRRTKDSFLPAYVVVKYKKSSYWYFNLDGHTGIGDFHTHEIMLYPSETLRDWSKYQ